VNSRRNDLPIKVDWGFIGVLIASATIAGLAVAQIIMLAGLVWTSISHI